MMRWAARLHNQRPCGWSAHASNVTKQHTHKYHGTNREVIGRAVGRNTTRTPSKVTRIRIRCQGRPRNRSSQGCANLSVTTPISIRQQQTPTRWDCDEPAHRAHSAEERDRPARAKCQEPRGRSNRRRLRRACNCAVPSA